MKQHNYFVYIMTNKKKTVLYTGVTNNLSRRVYEHQQGKIKGFTLKYKCFHLIYYERFDFIEHAIQREKEIKGWKREKKIRLIESLNPEWKFLENNIFNW